MRIIYIDIDSLRPDHTEPYGYHRRITPNLQEYAQDAVVFSGYYCSDSPCVPSRAALSTQQFGIVNGVIGHYGRNAQLRFTDMNYAHHNIDYVSRDFLGGYLYRNGIYTASISCFAERHLAYWFLGNFRELIKPTLSLGDDEDAANVNAAAIAWLQQHADEDSWFLHLNYWEPHRPYIEPQEWFQRAAESGPPPDWPDEDAISAHQEIYGPQTAADLHGILGAKSSFPGTMPDAISSRADYETLVNGYDGEVLYWDHHFGQLLNALDDLNILQDTAIVVSADHGEALGENGSYGEHGLANEPTHRVPLIIRWPGITDNLRPEQRRCNALLYNLDLGPTLCELLDLSIPESWHGQSFAPAVRGKPVAGRSHLVLGQGAVSYQRAVRTPDSLYIRTLHPGCFRAEWEQLFNVSKDPYLTHDILPEAPHAADEEKARLQDWWHEYAGRPGADPDPMQLTVDEGPALYFDSDLYIEHLRDTGRGHLARDLEERLERVG